MANTFDRIRHSLILHILSKFGFNNKFVQWVIACISGL
jgi:hypothetical protein